MGNLAPDVSADVVEDVMAKFKSLDRVIMKQGLPPFPEFPETQYICCRQV